MAFGNTRRLFALGTVAVTLGCSGGGGDGPPAPVSIGTIELSSTAISLEPGLTTQLVATARSALGTTLTNRPFTWSSAVPAVATVSSTGLVTGVSDGTTTITASAEGRSATATVTVRTPVSSVVVTPATATTIVGGTPVQLVATTLSSSGSVLSNRPVTWSSASPQVATVAQNGIVTGVAAGPATISATSEGRSGTAIVTVTVPDPCASVRSINVGQTFTGALAAADCRLTDRSALQAFSVTLAAAATLEIEMTSTVVDPYLYVLDAQTRVIAEDDDGGTGSNARVLQFLPAGQYFILANTFDPDAFGPFQLSVRPAPAPCVTARPTAVPATVNGALGTTTSCRLNDDSYVDFYDLTVPARSTIRVDMSSSVIDPFLIVFDASGELVAQDDDAGPGLSARIEVQLEAGRYVVVANAQATQLGAYRLDVSAVADPCGVNRTLNVGQTVTSTLTTSDCAVSSAGPIPFTQRWFMTVPVGTPLQLDMTSTVVDAYLIIQSATTGAVLAENDDVSQSSTNSRIAANFPPGQYIINASTYDIGEVGSYTLSATVISTTTPVSVSVTPTTLALASGQTQQVTPTVTGNANTAVTWETSVSSVATVSTTGLVRAVTPGNATITARSVADPSKTATVAVSVSQTQTGAANLDIAGMYLVQTVQKLDGSVKLVANRDAVARVFLRGSRTGIGATTVRVRLLQGSTVLATLQATVNPTLSVDEGCCSANIAIPAAHIRAGVSIVADADPQNVIAESNETDNSFPLNGTPQPLNVVTVSPFNVRLVPVRQNRSGQLGVATASTGSVLRAVWPLSTVNVSTRQPLGIDYTLLAQSFNEWSQLVRDLELARRAEVANTYYYGMVRINYTSGVLGLAGGIPAMSATGVDEGTPFGADESRFTFAHEMGHAIGLRHAPCGGAAGPDPAYPFANAATGVFGMDLASGNVIRGPTSTDIMGYCDNQWVSAYNYNNVLNLRAQFPNGAPASLVSSVPAPVLMVTGSVNSRQAMIDGSFAMTANPSISDPAGRFVLEGFASDGRRLFSHRFTPFAVSDGRPDDEAFVIGVPVDGETSSAIARITVRELNGPRIHARTRATRAKADADLGTSLTTSRRAARTELTWSTTSAPMVLVRDPRTAEVIGVGRNGVLDLAQFGNAADVDVLITDGVNSVRRRVNTATGAIRP